LRNELGFDGIHPNAEGYSIMEPLLENVLSKVVHTSCKNYM
jgi:lysophospholipase L1-like esterase